MNKVTLKTVGEKIEITLWEVWFGKIEPYKITVEDTVTAIRVIESYYGRAIK